MWRKTETIAYILYQRARYYPVASDLLLSLVVGNQGAPVTRLVT